MADPVTPVVPTSPPSGGGSAAAPAGASPPSALPTPAPTASFADTYKQTAAATAAPSTPAGTAAVSTSSTTPASASPAAEETVETLRAKLAAAEAGRISDEDLATMRHFAAIGAEAARKAQQPDPAAPAPSQAQQVVPDPLTGVIPFGDHELALLSRNADGQIVAEDGAPSDIIQRYKAHLRSVAEFQRKFAADPAKYLQPMIQAEAKKIAAAEAQQFHQQTTQEAAAAQIIRENTPWVYQHGADGKLLYDGYGNPKFTPEGDNWAAVATELWESGMRDRVKINQIAKRVVLGLGVERQASQVQQTAASPPAPVPTTPVLSPIEAEAAMKQRLLQQAQIMAGNAPLTGPAVPVPTAPTTRQTFLQTVKEVNAAQGSPLKLTL